MSEILPATRDTITVIWKEINTKYVCIETLYIEKA